MLFAENIRLAISAIKVNKMRSFLTMLGIIIGISSVIAITSIGDSAKGALNDEFGTFSSYMFLKPNWDMYDEYYSYDFQYFEEDLEMLKEKFKNEIKYISPYVEVNSDTKVGRKTGKLYVKGVADNVFKVGGSKYNLIYGRTINKSDVLGRKDVVIIDVEAARRFFGKEDVVGKTIPANVYGSRELSIVGVYEEKKSIFSALSGMDAHLVMVPYSLLVQSGEGVGWVEVFAHDGVDQDDLGKAITEYMDRVKGAPSGYFNYDTAQSTLNMINGMLGTLSIAIGAIAAISLVVGGIGIMNIMLVSVTERTREIGIRKSLGAQTKDILTQFLMEAMILAVIGGIIGTGLGIGIAAIGMSIAKVRIVVNPMVVMTAVSFSALVGIFFGIFPARKAAKLDPIEALRYE